MASYLTGQHSRGIQVSKGSCRGRICQVISRHINSLDGCNRTFLGRGDTFLKTSKIRSQCWLITHSRWDTTKQSRHFWVSLFQYKMQIVPQSGLQNKQIYTWTLKDMPTWVNLKILSIKRSTSCPSASRKCSATVKPVSPTRARAPGGSFIWPYTRAHLLSLWIVWDNNMSAMQG